MAILSVKLDLVSGIWQEVGAIAFVGGKGTSTLIELVCADALPVGPIKEAMSFSTGDWLAVPAPISGSWYVRIATSNTGVFKYTEVS